jgi:hypothetical protein
MMRALRATALAALLAELEHERQTLAARRADAGQ